MGHAPGARVAPIAAVLFCYFALVGGTSPYLSLYLDDLELPVEAIGVLMALPQFIRVVAPPVWGWLSDRSGWRVRLLRATALVAATAIIALPWAGPQAAGLFVALAVQYFALSAHGPVLESLVLGLAAGDAGRYGRIRLWGSIGFISAVLGFGWLLDRIGIGRLPLLMAGLGCLLVASSFTLVEHPVPRRGTAPAGQGGRLASPPAIAFFASAFLMIFAHAALYGFLSLYLAGHGYGKAGIGLLWALGVVAEIALFWWQKRLFSRFSAMALLAFSLLTAVLRFVLIAVSDGWLAAILVAQVMHAVTFGVHHSASMAVLHRWYGAERQARAQAAFATIGYGLGGSCGGLAATWLWTQVSPPAAFLGAALAALLGWGAIALCRRLDYAAAAARRGG